MMGLASPKRAKLGGGEVEEKKEPFSDVEFAALYVEFLEPLFHHYLYLSGVLSLLLFVPLFMLFEGVYAERFFEKCTAYGVPVWRAAHPKISSYVSSALATAKILIQEKQIERL